MSADQAVHDAPPAPASGRDELITGYVGLARSLARRFANRGELLEDLEQVASLALVKAADRFDPDRGVKFSTYAYLTIMGELKRHFRDRRWGVHVTRATQERYLAVRDAVDHLTSQLSRPPTPAEVAPVVGIEPEEVVSALDTTAAMRIVSLDAPAVEGQHPRQLGGPDRAMGTVEAKLAIEAALGVLGERELQIVELRFVHGLTQAEIGDRIGVSQMQVSRLLSRSLGEVRARLDG